MHLPELVAGTAEHALLTAAQLRDSRIQMQNPILNRYQARIAASEVSADPAQLAVIAHLDRLAAGLQTWKPGGGFLSKWFSGAANEAPRGLYIHGGVGRGKTMLMDLFYDTVTFGPKRRLHFHEFMAETHDLINESRHTVDGDPIPYVAASIARRAQLLCFDELHVTDVADAMILGRLFKKLFEAQVVIVATSNVAPQNLYKNGLQRQSFVEAITMIEQRMQVLELVAAKDYRLDKLAGQPLYFTPLGDASQQSLRTAFRRIAGVASGTPAVLEIKGRQLRINEAASGVACVTFAELCEQPLGALDYLAIANNFHTVIMDGIPVLRPEQRNAARRFVNLIDTLYDGRVCLIASAAAEPDELYATGDGAFLFERTASRLTEMRTEGYLEGRGQRQHLASAPA
jgi:cell division protein ZapE